MKIAAQTKWTFATAWQFIKSKIFAATTQKSPICVARRAVLKDEPPTRASSRATLMKMFTCKFNFTDPNFVDFCDVIIF
jgi:hypothetical protein